MNKILEIISDKVIEKKCWPLLGPIFLPETIFLFIMFYFDLSFRETFDHGYFWMGNAIVFFISGVLFYFFSLPEKRQQRRLPSICLAGVGIGLAVLAFFLLTPKKLPENKLVVAIVDFSSVGSGANDEAEVFVKKLYNNLKDRKQAGAPIEVKRCLKKTIIGPDEVSKRKLATALGRSVKVNCHILIWGEVIKDGTELTIESRITIAKSIKNVQLDPREISKIASIEPTHFNITSELTDFKSELSNAVGDLAIVIYGLAYLKAQQFDQTIKILTHTNTAVGYIFKGIAHLKLHQWEFARSAFENAVKHDPENAIAYNNLSIAYQFLGRFEESKHCLIKSLAIKPYNPDVLNNLGLLQLNTYEIVESAKSFNNSLKIKDNPIVRSNLAFSLFELGKTDQSVKEWERALKKLKAVKSDWDGLDAKAGLAVAYYLQGKTDAAIKLFEEVMQVEPRYGKPTLLATRFFWPKRARNEAIKLISQIKKIQK